MMGSGPDRLRGTRDHRARHTDADTTAATRAAEKSKNLGPFAARAVLRNFVKAERLKVRIAWIRANRDSFVQARLAGRKTTQLAAPEAP